MNRPERVESEPEVDITAIQRFVHVVFDGLTGFVDVRLLTEKGTPVQRPRCESVAVDERLAASLARCAANALRLGLACTVVPATTARRGRARTSNVTEAAVVLVDLDDGDIAASRAHLVRHLGPPTLVVASGGTTSSGQQKLHLYWRLAQPATGAAFARVSRLRETVARRAGGDTSFAKPSQPIRLAGSVHCKHGRRSPVHIVEHSGAAYALEALERAVEAMPPIRQTKDSVSGDPADETGRRRIHAGGIDGITRFEAVSRFVGKQVRLVRLGQISRAAAWRAVIAYNAERIDPCWSEARLRREFDALELVDRRNHRGAKETEIEVDRTEHGLARQLAAEHAGGWRYVPGVGWLAWTGTHWERDETNRLLELCRRLCEAAASRQPDPERRRLLTDRTIRAVERLARSDPRLATRAAEWNSDGMLLNTPAGVIDLRTGEVFPNDPRLQMTRITGAAPGNGCDRWRAFIQRITGGDADMMGYLQRIAGYCLTGRTDEQAFFLLHGSGANGKTVFLEVLAAILGSYAQTAPLDTFMAARADRQQNDLAGLDGARMVIATETEVGRPWAEARIKAVTGGDRIAVRRLYGEFFETVPAYKLLIAGNHRPRLTGGGTSMARRLHLAPFDTVIPEGERDGRLRDKLLDERSGILSWMIEGCRTWQDQGLAPPRKVREAVASYFDAEDFVADWIAEDCEVGPGHKARVADLYASWRLKAESLGIGPGNARDLGERLRSLGYESFRTGRARGWKGIRPLAHDGAAE